MMKIAITPPVPIVDEHEYIVAILEDGWDYVHLRHPSATTHDMRRLIEAIPQRLHNRLKLHGHFELLNEFNLGGIHLNSRCPEAPRLYSGKISRTCHAIDEAERFGDMEYVKTRLYIGVFIRPIVSHEMPQCRSPWRGNAITHRCRQSISIHWICRARLSVQLRQHR